MGDVNLPGILASAGFPAQQDPRVRAAIASYPPFIQQDPGYATRLARVGVGLTAEPQPPPPNPFSNLSPAGAGFSLPGRSAPPPPQPPPVSDGAPDFDHSLRGLGLTPEQAVAIGIEPLPNGGFRIGPRPQPVGDRIAAATQALRSKLMGLFGNGSAMAAEPQRFHMTHVDMPPQPGPPVVNPQLPPLFPAHNNQTLGLPGQGAGPLAQTIPTPDQMQQMRTDAYQAYPMNGGYPFAPQDPAQGAGPPGVQADLNYDLINRYLRHLGG